MNISKRIFLALAVLSISANGILAWPGQETASKAWNWIKGNPGKTAAAVALPATGIAAFLLYQYNPKVREAVNSNASKAKTFSTENLTKFKDKFNSLDRKTKIGLGAAAAGAAGYGVYRLYKHFTII